MKTYEQMAKDVLQQIDDINIKRRRRRQNAVRATVAVCCAVLTLLAGVSIPSLVSDDPVSSSGETGTPIATGVLQIAYLSENGWVRSEMAQQIETQMRYNLSVIDVRDMTAAQRENLRNELIQEQEEELSRADSVYRYAGWSVNSGWGNAMFVLLRGGSFQLDLNEEKTVESIRAQCSSIYGEAEFGIHSKNLVGQKIAYQAKWYDGTEQRTEKETRNGNVYLHAMSVTLDGATYDLVRQDGRFYVRWKPSSKLYEVLNEDPNKALSEFSDQMTITVKYADGSSESHQIDIVFHDDGNINAVYKGRSAE